MTFGQPGGKESRHSLSRTVHQMAVAIVSKVTLAYLCEQVQIS